MRALVCALVVVGFSSQADTIGQPERVPYPDRIDVRSEKSIGLYLAKISVDQVSMGDAVNVQKHLGKITEGFQNIGSFLGPRKGPDSYSLSLDAAACLRKQIDELESALKDSELADLVGSSSESHPITIRFIQGNEKIEKPTILNPAALPGWTFRHSFVQKKDVIKPTYLENRVAAQIELRPSYFPNAPREARCLYLNKNEILAQAKGAVSDNNEIRSRPSSSMTQEEFDGKKTLESHFGVQ